MWTRDRVGVLQRVLGALEVAAEMAGERREDAGAVLAGDAVERAEGVHQVSDRSHLDRAVVMFGIFAAHSNAASRSSTSIR